MAGRIPQHFIDDLLARINITDVVESRVKLRRSGKNYSGLCPFHKENSPSFTVSPEKQFYYCFGCGAGGNALGFLMEYENVTFPEAIEELARMAGVDIPKEEPTAKQREREQQVKQQITLLDQASQYYQKQLQHANDRAKANLYLKKRGLTEAIIQRFLIGYAPAGWDNLIQHFSQLSEPTKQLEKAGVVVYNEEKDRYYDRFRDRIMFPIRDMRGRVIGFGGRVLGDEKPKYLNSPETETFHKGSELYGLYEARQHNRQLDRLMIVEGYMDVVGLAQHGITWAVATLGTATSEQHIQRLFKLVPEIIFCFDGDKAGRSAAERALNTTLPLMEDGKSVRFLFLPEGEDPDSLVQKEGKDAFEQRTLSATPLSSYFFSTLAGDSSMDSMDERARIASSALPRIRSMKPSLLQQMMLDRVSEMTGLSADQLNSLISLQEMHQPAHQAATHQAKQSKASTEQTDDYYDYPELSAEETDYHPTEAPTNGVYKDYPAEKFYTEPKSYGIKRTQKTVSLVNRIISILLIKPELARDIDDLDSLGHLQESNIDLLIELISYFRQHPNNSIGTLAVDWQHDDQKAAYLLILGEISHLELIPKNADYLSELRDAIKQLYKRDTESQLDRLLKKKKQSPLTEYEKKRLQQLLLSGR